MARSVLGIFVALLLVAACGARETGGQPPQPGPPTFIPPTPTAYWAVEVTQTAGPTTPDQRQPATLTAQALEGQLQMTAQAISLILTTTPLSAEGYTAVALYETARTAATETAIPPEQRRPTPDPSQLAGVTSVPVLTPPPYTPGPDTQATDMASMLQTGEAMTATRAADYTATALAEGTGAATATPAAPGVPALTATPTPAARNALRFLLPPDLGARYVAANPQSSGEAYYVALTPRGEAPGPENTITLSGGQQAEAAWRENQPNRPDDLGAVIEPVSVRGVTGTIASGGYGHTISWMEDGQAYAVSYAAAGDAATALGFVEALIAVDQSAWDAAMRQAQQ